MLCPETSSCGADTNEGLLGIHTSAAILVRPKPLDTFTPHGHNPQVPNGKYRFLDISAGWTKSFVVTGSLHTSFQLHPTLKLSAHLSRADRHEVYGWGSNEGQFGTQHMYPVVREPMPVESLEHLRICTAATGRAHSIFLSSRHILTTTPTQIT